MSDDASGIARIGAYQLENLLKNRVQFLYLDLRSSGKRESEAPGHRLLVGSRAVEPSQALDIVRASGSTPDTPIVLISENGEKALEVARTLEENAFINVFVIEGGTEALGL